MANDRMHYKVHESLVILKGDRIERTRKHREIERRKKAVSFLVTVWSYNKLIFFPDIQVLCPPGQNTMVVTLHFNQNFGGRIYAKEYYDVQGCRTRGKGDNMAQIVLGLDSCGFKQSSVRHWCFSKNYV